MKKILLTGATGFFGSRIANYYRNNYKIYMPSHQEMDITNEESVRRVFDAFIPDIVIHCAAISDVGLCEKEPEKSYRINVEGSINIAKASKRICAKGIICSSDQVYFGSSIEEPHNEEEVLHPINIYGQHKLKAEQECLSINPDCVLLRLSWMYDTRTIRDIEHGDFFRTLLSKVNAKEDVSYPIYDKRGITDVNEVVAKLEKAFQIPGGIYNFGSSNDKSTFDTVYELFEKMNWDIRLLHKNEEAFKPNPRNLCMCQNKIEKHGISFSKTSDGLIRNFLLTLT